MWQSEMFQHMARVLNGSMSLNEALTIFLEASSTLLGLETGWIWLWDEQRGFHLAASRALPEGFSGAAWTKGACYCQSQFAAGELDDAQHVEVYRCSRLDGLTLQETSGLSFHISVGLESDSTRYGILNLASAQRRTLSTQELEQLDVVRDLLVMAIERAESIEHVRQQEVWQQREHLARQVHDTIAQNLAGVLMLSEVLDTSEMSTQQQQLNERIASLTRESLEDVRHMVTDWRHHPARHLPLDQSIKGWLQQRVRGELTWSCDVVGDLMVSSEHRRALFRVVQEGVHNALHHAQANHIHVALTALEREVVVCVEDDGHGFDVERGLSAGGLGMRGIQERIRAFGGEAFWHSAMGEGTVLECRVPRRGEEP